MGTPISGWEGNIGSAPEFKEFPNGNKEPRRLLRINVYFDNSIPKEGGGYEDRGGSGRTWNGGTKMPRTMRICSRKACAFRSPAAQ